MKAAKAGALLIEGAATYGGRDLDRVKRGDVNAGAIQGEMTPAADRLSSSMSDSSMPVDEGRRVRLSGLDAALRSVAHTV